DFHVTGVQTCALPICAMMGKVPVPVVWPTPTSVPMPGGGVAPPASPSSRLATSRSWVALATDSTHGASPGEVTEPGAGPSLPAEIGRASCRERREGGE